MNAVETELRGRPASPVQKCAGTTHGSNDPDTYEGADRRYLRRWPVVGSARKWDGAKIRIDLEHGPYPGVYVIESTDANSLLLLAEQVPVAVYSPELKQHPLIGSARWSESGTMILLDLFGTSRYGSCQIPGASFTEAYLGDDHRPVAVVVPPGGAT